MLGGSSLVEIKDNKVLSDNETRYCNNIKFK